MITDKLILGTVQFGLDYGINNKLGKVPDQELREILDQAYQRGIRILDTAEAYGDSQERIGMYHRSSSNRFEIVTKFQSARELDISFSIKKRVFRDIETLGVENLYGYMFHSFIDFTKYFDRFKQELLELKEQKIVQKIGVSIYTNEELEAVLNTKAINLIQLPFNLLDNESLRAESLRKAKEKGIEIHTRSAFLQGLFFKDLNTISENLVNLQGELERLKKFCVTEDLDMAVLALNYPMSKEYIDKVLIGVDSSEQLMENIESLKKIPKLSILEQIDQIEVEHKKLLNPSLWRV